MKYIFYIFIFSYTVLPFSVLAQEFNAGIVHGLWYSQEKIFAGEPVRIYVAIRNNTGVDMTGTVEFYDGDTRIARKHVSALNGRIIESWADWIPDYGEHTISATLSRTKLQAIGGNAEIVEVTSALAEDTLFIDYDTDKDGVGNMEDTDDDGDGISDEDELKNGTDPLQFDKKIPEPTTEQPSQENTQQANTSTSTTNSDNTPKGLEQYLTPSRADTLLSNVTQAINSTKEKLDAYRYKRTVAQQDTTTPVEEITVNENGFGEITRISKEERVKTDKNPKVQKPEGFLGDLFTFAGTVINDIYTGILTALSWLLKYPILIQLLLLFSILLFLYKTAKRLGGRPR